LNHNEVVHITKTHLLGPISELYALEGYEFSPVEGHDGGRNVVFTCEKEGAEPKILRISYLPDRSREDVLAEAEYVRYLAGNGGSVADVIPSRSGELVEEITHGNHTYLVCLFHKARGKSLAENRYRYREGVPLAEYFYNCGKTLGKLHHLSKGYRPVHRRYSFSDKYNTGYINELIPASLTLLREKLAELLATLEGLDRSPDVYGMVHFDYSDGNYRIDYDNGDITVFDFDNSCFCWYMYDLANLWTHGTGWVQRERDTEKRWRFMEEYFAAVLEGYRSETGLEQQMLDQLTLFIQTVLMENIVDAFEVMRHNGEEPECDEELLYKIKCMEEDIPYMGFFHDIYSCEAPFEFGTSEQQ
jgi:Ser/Thr protein kinase RdoA (MazF antagonist)